MANPETHHPKEQPESRNFLTDALSAFKGFMEGIKTLVDSTRSALGSLKENIFGKTANAGSTESTNESGEAPIEQVRKIIDANKERKEFYAIAGKVWRAIQALPSEEIHNVDKVSLWKYMMALSQQESGHNPKEVNRSSGAFGLYQIMPANFREWGLTSGKNADVEEQVQVAAKKLSGYYQHYKKWDLVSVAWFGGASRATALQKGDKSVGNLKDSGGKSITDYHKDVAAHLAKLERTA
ncbi:hypothetical protein COW46_01240 [Candidatus Gracilibacteria bacterium CG17_big_fil_post_rev_8_21_14_2_50_48_13]|nr:MAG: hypothetical protein COW46_01240 [Candidatus Gracilibacteria bacterium CG17_big_fil_post_rev_8_21_14_2_50_48_13]